MRLLISPEWAPWVASHIPRMGGGSFGDCQGIGVVSDAGELLGGVIFHNYLPDYGNIELSMASVTPKWLTRSLISGILNYPFSQLGCGRITAITPRNDATSISRFLVKFGFAREGLIRKGFGDDDAVVWGLLANEWRLSRFNVNRAVEYRSRKGGLGHRKVQPLAASGSRSSRRGQRAKPVQRHHREAGAEAQ